MANNHMEEIAKMFGVELGEKFIVKNSERTEEVVLYKGGLLVCDENGGETYNPKLFTKILCGVYEIERKPWEPKYGDMYFFPDVISKNVMSLNWIGSSSGYALKALGVIYRTEEEVYEHFAEDFERLTGKPLEGK